MLRRSLQHSHGRDRSLLPGLVSCPINTLLDPPANFRAGQGAPTRQRQLKGTGEEAQRRPARKGAAQRVRYLWDRTLVYRFGGAAVMAARSSVSFVLITAALSGPIRISNFCPAGRDSSAGSAKTYMTFGRTSAIG